jgi:hypothetical protein
MKALKVIIGWILPHALVRRKMSNDRAFLSITEEAAEALRCVGFITE